MKTTQLLLAIVLSLAFTTRQGPDTALSGKTSMEDKAFLIDYFEKTQKSLLEHIDGLNDGQIQFRPRPDRWSIVENVEHLVLTDAMIFGMVQGLMEQPANPEKRSEIGMTDRDILDYMADRSRKDDTSEHQWPKGSYTDTKAAAKAFKTQQKDILKFLKNASEDDLRNHVADTPMGVLDAYLLLLILPAHTARHTEQINEVKAADGFPKE